MEIKTQTIKEDLLLKPALEQQVRERAYHLWKESGELDGQDTDHWTKAEQEFIEQPETATVVPRSAPAT